VTTITVKNIPDELYEQLKQSAAHHRRSVNSEIIFWLERILGAPKVDVQATIARARLLREEAALYVTSNEEINTLKSEGRP
jgi:plasmid stability protein